MYVHTNIYIHICIMSLWLPTKPTTSLQRYALKPLTNNKLENFFGSLSVTARFIKSNKLVYMFVCRKPHIPFEHAQHHYHCCHWFYMVLVPKAINFLRFQGLVYFDKTYVTYVRTYLTWWARKNRCIMLASVCCKC